MKFVFVFAVAFCLAVCFASQSLALPAPEEGQFIDGLEALSKIEPELHGRYKRATCDLLSAANVGHTACAAHCLLLGHRGGYCNGKAICVCRD